MQKHHEQIGENHQPVLTEEVLNLLDPNPGETFLDLTAGFGGHAELVIARTGSPAKATLVDRDAMAIKTLQTKFIGADVVHSDFRLACQDLAKQNRSYDLILADLGVSSPQLDKAERGFSFGNNGPSSTSWYISA